MRHCLQTIIGDSAFLTAASRPALTLSLNNVPLRRSYTGTSYERSRAGQEANRDRLGDESLNKRRHAGNGSGQNRSEKDNSSHSNREGRVATRNNNDTGPSSQSQRWRMGDRADVSPRTITRKKWLDSRGIRPPSKKEVKTARTDSDIRQHLSYLNDPLKLADFVRQTLRKDDFDFAQELVRAASKNNLCVVSWNHLVEWQLSRGKLNAAISTFNEVSTSHEPF